MGRKELVLINLAPASSPCLLTGLLALGLPSRLVSDSSMSTSASPPVDSEEGGASGMSMGACTAG